MPEIILPTLADTQKFAQDLARRAQDGDVITLQGDLGAGKSELARAFIKALAGQDTVVPSPTFTILEQYQTPFGTISHFDLYRIESVDELIELGFDEALSAGISLIEWPERLGEYKLDNLLQIYMSADSITEIRKIFYTPHGSWESRLF